MAIRTLEIATNQVLAAAHTHAILTIALDSDELVVAPDGIISLSEQQLKTDENGKASIQLWPSAQLRPPTNYRISANNTPPCIFTMPDTNSDLEVLCGAGPAEIPTVPEVPNTPTELRHPTTVYWELLGTFGPYELTTAEQFGTGIILPADADELSVLNIEVNMDGPLNHAAGAQYFRDDNDYIRTYPATYTSLPISEPGNNPFDNDPDTGIRYATNAGLARTTDRELMWAAFFAGQGTFLKSITAWRSPYRTVYPRE